MVYNLQLLRTHLSGSYHHVLFQDLYQMRLITAKAIKILLILFHNSLGYLCVLSGGQMFPAKSYKPNFENNLYARSYLSLFMDLNRNETMFHCRVAGNMNETRGGKQTCLFHDRRSQTEQHKRALMAKDRTDTCAIAVRSSNKYDATSSPVKKRKHINYI